MRRPMPYVRISSKGFSFNAECMKLMPDVGYVQFRHSFEHGKLCAVECSAIDKNRIPWRFNCNSRDVRAKHVKWPRLYRLICESMKWIIGNEYRIGARLEQIDGKRLIVFNLTDHSETSPFWNLKLSDLLPVDVETESLLEFRFADRGDCALILRYIRDLAEYECLGDEVAASEELLAEWLFDKGAAGMFFAVAEGREVGFALFFPNFSTFLGRAGLYLEDIYVLPEYRGRGIGTAMLRELARISVERRYGRFEWACLDWNTPAIDLYRSFGAKPMSGWTTYRLSGDALKAFANGE